MDESQLRRQNQNPNLRQPVKIERQTVDPTKFGRAGLRLQIDEMLESHHGLPVDEWAKLGKEALDILHLIARGDEPHLFRKRSIAVLGQLRDISSLPYLAPVLAAEDEDPIVRIAAAAAIGEIGSDVAVDILWQNVKEPNPSIRYKIVQSLGKIADLKSLGRLRELAQRDTSDLVRTAAANASERIAIVHGIDLPA